MSNILSDSSSFAPLLPSLHAPLEHKHSLKRGRSDSDEILSIEELPEPTESSSKTLSEGSKKVKETSPLSTSVNEWECTICQLPMKCPVQCNPVEPVSSAGKLACGHHFCIHCLLSWVAPWGAHRYTCPQCRAPLNHPTPFLYSRTIGNLMVTLQPTTSIPTPEGVKAVETALACLKSQTPIFQTLMEYYRTGTMGYPKDLHMVDQVGVYALQKLVQGPYHPESIQLCLTLYTHLNVAHRMDVKRRSMFGTLLGHLYTFPRGAPECSTPTWVDDICEKLCPDLPIFTIVRQGPRRVMDLSCKGIDARKEESNCYIPVLQQFLGHSIRLKAPLATRQMVKLIYLYWGHYVNVNPTEWAGHSFPIYMRQLLKEVDLPTLPTGFLMNTFFYKNPLRLLGGKQIYDKTHANKSIYLTRLRQASHAGWTLGYLCHLESTVHEADRFGSQASPNDLTREEDLKTHTQQLQTAFETLSRLSKVVWATEEEKGYAAFVTARLYGFFHPMNGHANIETATHFHKQASTHGHSAATLALAWYFLILSRKSFPARILKASSTPGSAWIQHVKERYPSAQDTLLEAYEYAFLAMKQEVAEGFYMCLDILEKGECPSLRRQDIVWEVIQQGAKLHLQRAVILKVKYLLYGLTPVVQDRQQAAEVLLEACIPSQPTLLLYKAILMYTGEAAPWIPHEPEGAVQEMKRLAEKGCTEALYLARYFGLGSQIHSARRLVTESVVLETNTSWGDIDGLLSSSRASGIFNARDKLYTCKTLLDMHTGTMGRLGPLACIDPKTGEDLLEQQKDAFRVPYQSLGSPLLQYMLGLGYESGLPCLGKQDTRAVYWYERALLNAFTPGCPPRVFPIHEVGIGEEDASRLACEKLVQRFLEGTKEIPQDSVKAARYCILGQKYKSHYCTFLLANWMAEKLECRLLPPAAKALIQVAYDMKDEASTVLLCGQLSFQWYTLLAQEGYGPAQLEMAQQLDPCRSSCAAYQDQEALRLQRYETIKRSRLVSKEDKVTQLEELKQYPPRSAACDLLDAQAAMYYLKAAEQGVSQAQYYLSVLYRPGIGTHCRQFPKDAAKALYWTQRYQNSTYSDPPRDPTKTIPPLNMNLDHPAYKQATSLVETCQTSAPQALLLPPRQPINRQAYTSSCTNCRLRLRPPSISHPEILATFGKVPFEEKVYMSSTFERELHSRPIELMPYTGPQGRTKCQLSQNDPLPSSSRIPLLPPIVSTSPPLVLEVMEDVAPLSSSSSPSLLEMGSHTTPSSTVSTLRDLS